MTNIIAFPTAEARNHNQWLADVDVCLQKRGFSAEIRQHVAHSLRDVLIKCCPNLDCDIPSPDTDKKAVLTAAETVAKHFQPIVTQLLIEIMDREIELYRLKYST